MNKKKTKNILHGDWGLGIGDWGLGIGIIFNIKKNKN